MAFSCALTPGVVNVTLTGVLTIIALAVEHLGRGRPQCIPLHKGAADTQGGLKKNLLGPKSWPSDEAMEMGSRSP